MPEWTKITSSIDKKTCPPKETVFNTAAMCQPEKFTEYFQ